MRSSYLIFAVAFFASCAKMPTSVVVENSFDVEGQRLACLQLSTDDKALFSDDSVILINERGEQVPYQLTHDDQLLFLTEVKAGETSRLVISRGQRIVPDTIATGRVYPDRLDDVAWENDRGAYRAYGPALQRKWGNAFGYDIFTKSVSYPVVEDRYRLFLSPELNRRVKDLRASDPAASKALADSISYHIDHGNGMDCYAVGPTLGGGASAILMGDSIVYPLCYQQCDILDNGPLRFCMRLTFPPTLVDGQEITEVRTITLDALSQLNHTIVEYRGAQTDLCLCAGPVLHDDGPTFADIKTGILGYADPTEQHSEANGSIFVGAVFVSSVTDIRPTLFSSEEAKQRNACGHLLAYTSIKPGQTFDYYWGSAWDKYNINTLNAWKKYLTDFSVNLRKPLKVYLE